MKIYLTLAVALCVPLLMYYGLGWPWRWAVVFWVASAVAIILYSFGRIYNAGRPADGAARER